MQIVLYAVLALAGGALPCLAWLWFWLREDSEHPEPRRLIAAAFLAGMVTVAFVIPIQNAVAPFVKGFGLIALFAMWSVIEEASKYIAAYITVLRRPENDEPIDAVIYMIVVALGFAAVENSLFLFEPLQHAGIVETILTGNLRFIGATLLHVFSSGVIGLVLGLSFFKPARTRHWYAAGGVILAALLHSGFNALILSTQDDHLLRTFALVWIGVVVMLALIERIKRLGRDRELMTI